MENQVVIREDKSLNQGNFKISRHRRLKRSGMENHAVLSEAKSLNRLKPLFTDFSNTVEMTTNYKERVKISIS